MSSSIEQAVTVTKKRSRRRTEMESSPSSFDDVREFLARLATTGSIPDGVETRNGSSVLRIPCTLLDSDGDEGMSSDTYRLMYLPFMTGFSRGGSVLPSIFASAQGALLAQQHFNRRSESVVPNLRELLTDTNGKECDLKMTLDFYDTGRSPRIASKLLSQHVCPRGFPYEPSAIVGAGRSSVSVPMAVLNTVQGLPQVSYASTSSTLNNRDTYAMFGRTVPSNDGDAQALVEYYRNLGVSHFGVVYIQDEYGTAYRHSLERAALKYGMQVSTAAIKVDQSNSNQNGLGDGIADAVARLKSTGYRFFVGIIFKQHLTNLIEESSQAGIMGPGYVWLFGDGVSASYFRSLRFTEGTAAARAVHGLGLIGTGVASHDGSYHRFMAALAAEDNEEFRSYYASKTVCHCFVVGKSFRPPTIFCAWYLTYNSFSL